MRRSRSGRARAALSLLILAPLLAAQSAAPAAQESIPLAYKHVAGRVQKFRVRIKSEMAITQVQGMFGPLPANSEGEVRYSERVTEARDRDAALSVQVEALTLNTEVLGTRLGVRLENGQFVTTLNGQPGGPLAEQAASSLQGLRKPVTLRRDARGNITADEAAGAINQLPGATSLSLLQLPDRPVRAGESWETSQRIQLATPGPSGGAVPPIDVDLRVKHTLRTIESRDGRREALIDSEGRGTSPAAQAPSMAQQSVKGTTRFDLDRGVVVSGRYTMEFTTQFAGDPNAGQGAIPPGGLRTDGVVEVNLAELP